MSLQCCHICKDLSGSAVLLRGARSPTSEVEEMRALSGSQVALEIARAVLLPLGEAFGSQGLRRGNLSAASRPCCNSWQNICLASTSKERIEAPQLMLISLFLFHSYVRGMFFSRKPRPGLMGNMASRVLEHWEGFGIGMGEEEAGGNPWESDTWEYVQGKRHSDMWGVPPGKKRRICGGRRVFSFLLSNA